MRAIDNMRDGVHGIRRVQSGNAQQRTVRGESRRVADEEGIRLRSWRVAERRDRCAAEPVALA